MRVGSTRSKPNLAGWEAGREASVNGDKQVIKRFWRWLASTPQVEIHEEVDWINTKCAAAISNGKLPGDLLKRENVDDLKNACRNSRDRAFIAILYETGA